MADVSQQEIWDEKERYYLERISALEDQVKMLDRRNKIDMMLMESQIEVYAAEIESLQREKDKLIK